MRLSHPTRKNRGEGWGIRFVFPRIYDDAIAALLFGAGTDANFDICK